MEWACLTAHYTLRDCLPHSLPTTQGTSESQLAKVAIPPCKHDYNVHVVGLDYPCAKCLIETWSTKVDCEYFDIHHHGSKFLLKFEPMKSEPIIGIGQWLQAHILCTYDNECIPYTLLYRRLVIQHSLVPTHSHSAFFPCDTDLNFDPIIGSIFMQTSLFTFHRWPVINKHEEIMLS